MVITGQPPEEGPEEPVFTVLSGNILEKAEKPTLDSVGFPHPSFTGATTNSSQLPPDFPLILVAGEGYERQKSKGYQISGFWVNAHGWLKPETSSGAYICRWSFRRIQAAGPWNPRPTQPDEIHDGDQVTLFCHSIGYGLYADVNMPPINAPAVKYHSAAQQLICHGFGDPQRGGWDLAHKYDEGKLTQDELANAYKSDRYVSGLLTSDVAPVMLGKDALILRETEKRYWNGGWRGAVFTVKFV